MASWFDLPAEVMMMILEYLLSHIKVKFTAQFASTRLATRKSKEQGAIQSNTTDAINSLLLVSKAFVTNAEMGTALLRCAKIFHDSQTLYKIEKRFGSTGLVVIKELYMYQSLYGYRSNARIVDELPSARSLQKLQSLQRITFFLNNFMGEKTFNSTQPELLQVASGRTLKRSGSTLRVRQYLENLLVSILNRTDYGLRQRLVQWLTPGNKSSTIERVLVWKIEMPRSYAHQRHKAKPSGTMEIRFSTANWCVELTDGVDSVLCPQRNINSVYMMTAGLRQKTEGVAVDKYYTTKD